MASRMVRKGFLEVGPAEPPYAKHGEGFRLTKEGWATLDLYQRKDKAGAPRRLLPKLEPLIKPLSPRLRESDKS